MAAGREKYLLKYALAKEIENEVQRMIESKKSEINPLLLQNDNEIYEDIERMIVKDGQGLKNLFKNLSSYESEILTTVLERQDTKYPVDLMEEFTKNPMSLGQF
jgi:succinate dehydrogenase flavin-adding protein (antitoxin of CptAB toxin-antitoxin module)